MTPNELRELERSTVLLLLHDDYAGSAAMPDLESRFGHSLAYRQALGELFAPAVLLYRENGVELSPAVQHVADLGLITEGRETR